MENNEYFCTDITEETKDELILMGFNELPYSIYNDEAPVKYIINKTKRQFWLNSQLAIDHAKQMTKITPITFKDIKEWQTN